ncbi:hypothetical protein BD311DRAFT_758515, partial [Dichomitus squalens]
MYATTEDLGLERGKRYVSAAICACADDARQAPNNADPLEFLARSLERLASTWVAFMLWPFYAQQEQVEPSVCLDDVSGNATPTGTTTKSTMDDAGLSKNRSGDLRGDVSITTCMPGRFSVVLIGFQVGRREGHRCILTGHMDEVAHIFKRALMVYNRNTTKQGTRSITATLEILQHYCQL